MSTTADCIERLQAVADEELRVGTDPLFLIAAIAEVAVKVAKADPDTAAANLENLASIITVTSQAMRGRHVMENLRAAIFDR